DQRLGDALERFPPQPPRYEGTEALVGIAAAGQHEIHGHPELAGPGEQSRADEGPEARGGEELEALGQGMEAAAEDDEGAAEASVRADEPVLDAETPTEGEAPRLLGKKRVGAALHEKALVPLGLDRAAQPVSRLEQRELGQHPVLAPELDRAVGR